MIMMNEVQIGYKDPLLKPLNFSFQENKIYGILGPSGCGKSTLLRTIAHLQKPLAGKIRYSSEEPIYMMCQRYTNFDWLTCLENILIAERSKQKRKDRKEEAVAVLQKVGLGNYLEKYPKQLSGGEQQRLAIARMLFIRPKCLLMDEPLSALDDATRKRMQQLVLDLHLETKNTIIMVTHSPAEAKKMCDCIIELEKEKRI